MAELEKAIREAKAAVDATPHDHPDRARRLNILGNYLGDRYWHTGAMADLDEAIKLGREVIESTPQDDPNRAGRLNSLAVHLSHRYSHAGAMVDLEEAIKLGRETITSLPQDDPHRAGGLSNLATHLSDRYTRTGVMADLEEAIRLAREAIKATPQDNPNRIARLNNLGGHLQYRYSRTGAMADLEKAIEVAWEAIDATPKDYPHYINLRNNLAVHLSDRYSRKKSLSDLEDAIRLEREAIEATEATQQNHPGRADLLNNLGVYLSDKYSHTKDDADLDEAKKSFLLALKSTSSPTRTRVEAGRRFVSSPFILEDPEAYTIAKATIDLIPFLTPRSLKNTDKRHLLSAAVGLSSDAAAIALHVNKRPATAVELLETGRGVIAAALFEQADVSALESQHADLARQFIELRNQLDTPVSTGSLDTIGRRTAAAQAEGGRRREAEQQRVGLLEKIRSKPGFTRFLLSASEADMLTAAKHGPIIVVNVSSLRCDALIIDGRSESLGIQKGIRLVDLPHLSVETINNRARRLRSVNTLEWLWDAIVGPVLADLGFTEAPSDGQWPHIWWVPTGKLVRFPLHAAGYHLRRNGETALDRVVSSYASSVKAIIHARQRPQQAQIAQESKSAVIVAMKKTQRRRPLKFTNDEAEAVAKICELMKLVPNRPKRNKNAVLSALEACKIFHFAGHGGTDSTEPLQSRLLLEDWQREPLTVASLLETNLSSKAPFLAYLSACGTGQVLDESSVDESIHVANAFQLAGFRHVVGTLWSVDDKLCVEVAKRTYEYLLAKGIEDEFVSRGLHQASRRLRDQWVDDKTGARHWTLPTQEADKSRYYKIGPDEMGEMGLSTAGSSNSGSRSLDAEGLEKRSVTIASARGMIVDAVGSGKGANLKEGSLAWVPYVHYGV